MYGIPRGKQAQQPARGGPVVGPGTGTSDSIKTTVPNGSYIMPADSTAALGMNPDMLKQHKKGSMEAPRLGMGKGVPVNLSNGEYELPPEQVHAVGVQALDQAKGATHAPVEPRLGMGKELFFANGGLVDEEEKKRNSFDMINTPGNPQRAAQMQAQFDQPVTGPRGVVKPAADGVNEPVRIGLQGLKDFQTGALQVGAGLVSAAPAYAADGLRIAGSTLAGGDPDTLPGGRDKYRKMNSDMLGIGFGKVADAGASAVGSAQAAGRDALGVRPAQPSAPSVQSALAPVAAPALTPASTAAGADAPPSQQPQAPAVQAPPALDPNAWANAGNGISARLGINGAPEFTNEAATPGSVTGAQAMPDSGFARLGVRQNASQPGAMTAPAGSRTLASGTNAPRGDAEFARLGTINNIGNGDGGLSVGEDGDAQMAIGRFDRANQIRAEMNASRPREIGDNGGRATVVRDSSRAPTLAERLNDRRERADASADLDQRRVANDERRTDADIVRNTANDQVNQQLQGFQISAAQRAEQLYVA